MVADGARYCTPPQRSNRLVKGVCKETRALSALLTPLLQGEGKVIPPHRSPTSHLHRCMNDLWIGDPWCRAQKNPLCGITANQRRFPFPFGRLSFSLSLSLAISLALSRSLKVHRGECVNVQAFERPRIFVFTPRVVVELLCHSEECCVDFLRSRVRGC